MSPFKTVYLFRHGETDWNKAQRLQGSTDIPLNETGRTQALRLREFFVSNPIDVVLSSDLSRARETAEIARGNLNVEIVTDPRMRETNLGQAEGLTQPEIIERFGDHAWHAWYEHNPRSVPFRFPGGETKIEHLTRLLEGLEAFLTMTPHARIGVASHGGAMRRLIHHLRPEISTPLMVSNCALYELTFALDGKVWTIDLEAKCKAD